MEGLGLWNIELLLAVRGAQKDAPASSWIGEVMQNADRLDDIKSPVERAEFENVGVRVVDIVEARLTRFSSRISEARQTDINSQNMCMWEQ